MNGYTVVENPPIVWIFSDDGPGTVKAKVAEAARIGGVPIAIPLTRAQAEATIKADQEARRTA